MSPKPQNARAFIALITAAGVASICFGLAQTNSWHPYQALALCGIAAVASRMKIKLPGLAGNMSVNLPFLLIAVAELNLVEALVVAGVSAAVQCFPSDGRKTRPEQMLFNVSSMAFATALAWWVFQQGAGSAWFVPMATVLFFLGQTVPVSIIISLTTGDTLAKIWTSMARLTFPYFVLSAGVAAMMTSASRQVGWQIPLGALPVMFGVFCSYQTYFLTAIAPEKSAAMSASAAH